MLAVHEWVNGTSFNDILKLTTVFEVSIWHDYDLMLHDFVLLLHDLVLFPLGCVLLLHNYPLLFPDCLLIFHDCAFCCTGFSNKTHTSDTRTVTPTSCRCKGMWHLRYIFPNSISMISKYLLPHVYFSVKTSNYLSVRVRLSKRTLS